MGAISGDKSRYNRERRKKLARRVNTRALRATLAAQAAAAPPSKAGAATKRPAKSSAAPGRPSPQEGNPGA